MWGVISSGVDAVSSNPPSELNVHRSPKIVVRMYPNRSIAWRVACVVVGTFRTTATPSVASARSTGPTSSRNASWSASTSRASRSARVHGRAWCPSRHTSARGHRATRVTPPKSLQTPLATKRAALNRRSLLDPVGHRRRHRRSRAAAPPDFKYEVASWAWSRNHIQLSVSVRPSTSTCTPCSSTTSLEITATCRSWSPSLLDDHPEAADRSVRTPAIVPAWSPTLRR